MSSTDLPPNISPQLQEQLVKFEQLRKTLEAIPMQRQQVDLQILEINKALEELDKINENTTVYKSAGTIMIKANKDSLIKELTEAKDLGNSQLTLLKKQETRVMENIKELETKIRQSANKSNLTNPASN
mgnify:FL=1|jgi:prefoldin beta subunit|tara:strand:- start:44 stop:430 length:387 start_codon:yes stop_codon:yes gene_type:complete